MIRYLLLLGFALDSLVYIGAVVWLVLLWQNFTITNMIIISTISMIILILLALFSLKRASCRTSIFDLIFLLGCGIVYLIVK